MKRVKKSKRIEVTTQELRGDDVLVTAPIVRRKRKANVDDERANTSRHPMSPSELRPEVQEESDVS